MAKKGEKVLVFSVRADTSDAEKAITSLSNKVETFTNKDGIKKIKAEIDANDIGKFNAIINKSGSDKTNAIFDAESTREKFLQNYTGSAASAEKKFRKMLLDTIKTNNTDGLGIDKYVSESISKEYFEKRMAALNVVDGKIKEITNEINNNDRKNLINAYNEYVKNKKNLRSQEKLKFAWDNIDKDYITENPLKKKSGDIFPAGKIIGNAVYEINHDKTELDAREDIRKELKNEYNKSIKGYNNDLNRLKKIKVNRDGLSMEYLDEIINNDNFDIKEMAAKARKNVTTNKSYPKLLLDELEIAKGAKDGGSATVDKKGNSNRYSDDDFNYIYKRINSLKKKKVVDLQENLNNLISDSIDAKEPLDMDGLKELIALSNTLKAKGVSKSVTTALKSRGIDDFDEVIGGYGNLKDAYEDWLLTAQPSTKNKKKTNVEKESSVAVSTDVSEVDKALDEIDKLQENAEQPVTVSVDADSGDATSELDKIEEKKEEIDSTPVTVEVNANDDGALETIDETKKKKEEVNNDPAVVTIKAEDDGASDTINEINNKKEEIEKPINITHESIDEASKKLENLFDSYNKNKKKYDFGKKDINEIKDDYNNLMNSSTFDVSSFFGKNKKITKSGLKNLISAYTESVKEGKSSLSEELKSGIKGYVSQFENLDDVANLFPKKLKKLWDEITASINKAREAEQAFTDSSSNINEIDDVLKEFDNIKFAPGKSKDLIESFKSGDMTGDDIVERVNAMKLFYGNEANSGKSENTVVAVETDTEDIEKASEEVDSLQENVEEPTSVNIDGSDASEEVQNVNDDIEQARKNAEGNPINIDVNVSDADKVKKLSNEILQYTKDNNISDLRGKFDDYIVSGGYSEYNKRSKESIKKDIADYNKYKKEIKNKEISEPEETAYRIYSKEIENYEKDFEKDIYSYENPDELREIFEKENEELFNGLKSKVEKIKSNTKDIEPIAEKMLEINNLMKDKDSFGLYNLSGIISDGDIEQINDYIDKVYKLGKYAEEAKQEIKTAKEDVSSKNDNETENNINISNRDNDKNSEIGNDNNITMNVILIPSIDDIKDQIKEIENDPVNIKLNTVPPIEDLKNNILSFSNLSNGNSSGGNDSKGKPKNKNNDVDSKADDSKKEKVSNKDNDKKKEIKSNEINNDIFYQNKSNFIKSIKNSKSNINLDSIKISKDGVISFEKEVENAIDKVDVFTYKIKDAKKEIGDSETINDNWIKENAIFSGMKQRKKNSKEIKSDFEKYANNSNLEYSDFNINKNNGLITFTREVINAEGQTQKLKYEVENLYDVINQDTGKFNDEFIENYGKIIPKTQKELSKLKTSEQQKKKDYLNDVVKNTDGMKLIEPLVFKKDGMEKFSVSVKDVKGNLDEVKIVIDDINKVIKDGKIDLSSLYEFGQSSNVYKDLKKQTENVAESIIKLRKFEDINKNDIDSNTLSNEMQQEYSNLKSEIIAKEESLRQAIESTNMSEKRRLELIKLIDDAKQEELNLQTLANQKDSVKQTFKQYKNAYKEQFKGLETDNGISSKYLDINARVGDNLVNIQDRVRELRNEAKLLISDLENGVFASKNDIQEKINELKNIISEMNKINSSKFNLSENVLGVLDNIPEGSKNKTKSIYDLLSGMGYKNLKVSPYVEKNNLGSKVEFEDESGAIVKMTVTIDKQTQAIRENTQAKKENNAAGNSIGDIVDENEIGDIIDENKKAYVRFEKVNNTGKQYQSSGDKWLSGFKNKLQNLTQYVSGIEIVMRVWNEIQQGFSFVNEFNASLTTINQTMSATKEQLSSLGKGALDAGKNFGSTAEDVLSAAAIYANASETAEGVLQKAKPTMLLANASGTDVETVADQIQGVVNQFNELEGQETRIVNSYEKISSGLAIDFAKGINIMSEGVQTAGSVVEQAGMSFETYAASVGKISEKTRQEGSTIGNAYKTIMARMSRSKSADEDVSEEDRSNAAKAYKSIGIDLYDANGQYKDINETLDELASKWDSLTDAQRNYIAEQSAGVRNINTFSALIETWQEAQQLAKDATADTDFYQSVQEKYMDSMEAKLNTLRASTEGFWNSLLDTGTINLGIDAINLLVQALQGLINIFKTIGDITGNGTLATLLGIGGIGAAGVSLFKNIKDARKSLGDDAGLFGGFKTGFKQTGSDIVNFFSTLNKGFASFGSGFIDAWKNNKGAGVSRLFTSLSEGAAASGVAIGKVSSALLGLTVGIAVVTALVKLFDALTDSSEETAQKVTEAMDAYNKGQEDLRNKKSSLDSISAEWQQLSKGIDSDGNNISLTNDEFARYHELCNKIADILPSTVSGFDSQGNAILNLTGKVSELNAEYDKLVLNQAKTDLNNLKDVQNDYNNKIDNKKPSTQIWDYFVGGIKAIKNGGPVLGYQVSYEEALKELEKVSKMNKDELQKYYIEVEKQGNNAAANWVYSEDGLDLKSIFIEGLNDENWATVKKGIQTKMQEVEGVVEESASNYRKMLQTQLKVLTLDKDEYPEYSNLDDSIINNISSLLDSLPQDKLEEFGRSTSAAKTYIEDVLKTFSNNKNYQISLSNILGINEDTSIEDIRNILDVDFENIKKALGITDDEGVAELKVKLKLDGADELIKSYDEIVTTAAIKLQEEGKKQLDSISKTYKNNLTDIDLYNRPVISSYEMNKHGWKTDDGTYSTYFSDIKNELDENGNIEKSIVFTPIYKDEKGNEKVLTPDEFEKETERILAGGEDTKGLKIAEFDSKDYKDSAKAAGKFAERLHKASDYYDLLEEDAGRVKDFIEDNNINTKEQIDLLNSLMDKYGNWSDVMANWGAEAFDLEVNADSLDALESNLDIVKEKIGKIQDAYKESITSSGMTKESIENVVKAFSDLDYNYDNLFESTASGVHMNAQELAKMNAQYEKHEKAKYEGKLKEEIKSYEDICRAIEEANTLSEKQALIRDRDGLAEQIQRTNELISRYEGLTNAVTKYQQALEMGEEGDVYDSIVSGYENAKTLWGKGLVGTNEFKAFTQMFSNEDLTGKGVEAYVNAWQAAQGKMTRWLSEGGEGVENFLYDIRALNSEWAKLDANGNWNLDGLPDMKTLAKNLGISESLIDQMMRKLHDYGFEINFSEAKDNLRYMLQDAKEINKQFGQFSQFGLNDDDLKKVTSDAEQLQKMKEFKFNLEVSDPKALDEQISIAGKLRTALVDAFGNGSEEVEKFDKQLDYLKAKRGELTDVSTLAKEGYSLGLDFTKDKEALDDIIEKLMTIKGFNNMNINLEMNTIDDVNNNLDILTGKINNLARDENGKVDLSADGAAEALELYSALIAKKREFDLTETSIYKFDSTKLKTGAQQNAIEYLQAFQKASSELQNAYDVNNVFGAGTIDVKPLETNMLNALDKIKNSGEDVQEIFKNLGFDISDISKANIDDYVSLMNYVNAQIRDIGSADVAGISGSLTDKIEARTNDLKELKQKAEDANKILKDNYYEGLNLDVDSLDGIKEQINQGEWLMKTLDKDSESAKALQKQLDYLNQKKLFQESSFSGDLNLDLNYTDNKEKIDEIVTSLTSIDTYKNLEIDFKVKDPDDIDGQITNISKELEKLKDPKTGKIDFTQEGASELMDTMIALYNQKQLLTNEHRSYMNVDTSGATDAQKSALGNVQQLQNSMDQLNKIEFMKKFVPDIDTSAAQKAVADAWKEIQNGTEEEKRIYANLGIEPDKIKVDSDEINDETQKAIQDELDPIDCEVLVNAGYDIKTVDKLTEDLDYLKDEYNVDIDIDWESLSPEYIEDKIEDLKGQLKDLRGEDGIIKIGEEGYDQARELMLSLIKMKQQAEGNVVLSIDTSQLEGETQKAITDLQEVMNAYQQLQSLKDLQAAGVEVDTSELDAAQTKLNGLVADFANSHPETAATVGLTIKEGDKAKIVSDVNAALAGITADMMVKAGVDSTLVDGYSPEDKDATVTYNVNKAAVTTFLNSNIDRTATVTYNIKTVGSVPGGGHKLNGTAHLNGTAYANGTTGNWGAKKTETALVGEVAPELRVNSKTGRWELLGEHGAEFAKINKGDVIFNSKQTMELFKNGYVTSGFGRGRSFLNGTIGKLNSLFKTGGKAYAYGSYGGGGRFYKNSQFYANKTAAVSQGSTKSGKAADEFKETIDWIEIMIDRLERKISELDTIASSAYKKFSKRNTTLADEFSKVTQEIELQQKAYDAYMNKANSLGLSATYANRVINGELRIEDITDEELKKKIDEFQDWVDKALDARDAINDLNETLGDLVKQNFDNINDEFDYILDQIEHQNTMLENQLDIIENRGNFAGDAYFEALMKNEQDYVDELQKKYESLIAAREEAMNSGSIEVNSEAFYEMQASIDEVSEAYAEANNQLLEYKNNMYEMRWDVFDKTIEYLSDITEEAEFIRNLLSVNENDLFTKKTGRLNEKGMASGALMAQDYNVQMGLADKYREKIEELNAELEKDPTNTILIDKKLEYVQAQREAIEAANDEKKAIQDLVSESYDRMLDVLQELIDKRKEALEAEKDLYSYQKDVEEQTKNITDLQKQLMALGGDTSEETRAKRQELQTSLKEAQSDLEETEYDQWLTDQEKMMDDLYSEYERILNERLDNIDGLLMDMIDYGNQNSETVVQTITDATTAVGYNITDGMNMIWNSTDSGLGKIMTDYSANFNSQMTTINEYLKFIFKKMGGVVKEEVEQTKPKEPEKKPDTGGSSTTTTPTNPTPTQPPKKQITVGGLINAGSARIYGNSAGQGGGTQYFASDPIYTVLSEQNGYVLTRWHKLSSGYTGWFKKSDVTAMNTGGYTGNYEGMAMLHAKERVLNATQTAAFEKLVYDFLPKISDEIGKLNNLKNVTSAIYNRANNNNSTIENSIDLTLNLPNVKNGDDFIKTLQTDKNIQKIIRSFTIDEAMGKNSLRKFNVK